MAQAKKGAPAKGAPQGQKPGAGGKKDLVVFNGTETKGVAPRLRDRFNAEIVPALQEEYKYVNIMQIPKIEKIVVNMGVGEAVGDSKQLEAAVKELALITGQKPLITKARKSIATFKLRTGYSIGAKVTLRGVRMWEFLDRLLSVAIPRIRDFQGLPYKSFDGRGNYSLGLRDQTIFSEINIDTVNKVRGMDITIVTTAKTDDEARFLLTKLGLPLRKS